MPSIGMLLCKDHSNDPPTSAASAHLPPTKALSASTDPQATANDPASSDDGPPPPKSRRQTTVAMNAARRHGTPLGAEQVSMSKKQSKRAYNEVSSGADEKAGKSRSSKKRPPLADVTNSAAVPAAVPTRRKRAARKQLDLDWSDSASDGGSSSSSEFHPDADHVSEDKVGVGEHPDLDANDLDVGVTASDSGEPSARSEVRKGIADRYKHPVWTFFSIDEETLAPTCRACLTQFASPPCSGRARKHLQTRHAKLYEKLERLIAESGYAKKIGLDELQTHSTNIAQHWNRDSSVLRCPVCNCEVKARTPSNAFQHLLTHLGDKGLFPYRCPVDGCDQAAVLPETIHRHLRLVHKLLDWTDELNPPPDPPLDAASANPASSEHLSISKDAAATSSRQVARDDGPPPTKERRPKRAAAKAPILDSSDSESDGVDKECTSSSDFEPDADHVSEDKVGVGEHSDLDANDLDVGVTASDSGEPSARSEVRKGIADRYKHPVWTFFSIDEETLAPTCRACLTQFASPPDSGRARKHLQTRHAKLYEKLERLIAESGYAKKIGLDELQTHTTNIAQHWNRDSSVLRCPVCNCEVKARTPSNAFQHLLTHLGDKGLFPYRCPVDGCDQAAVLPETIHRHLRLVHKLLDWTDELAASCVHAENKARLDALLHQIHETATLLLKNPPPDPPLDAASANPASSEHLSISKDAAATSSRQVARDDGPPPTKERRPKRAAAKAPILDSSDSESDGVDKECTSSSDFEPDADHVSEDEVDVEEHSDPDADDLDVGVTASDSGEPSDRNEVGMGIADRYKHPVWTFYSIDEETLAPTCRSCLTQLASPPGTSNATKHLRTRHAKLYEKLERLIAERWANRKMIAEANDEGASYTGSRSSTARLRALCAANEDQSQKLFHELSPAELEQLKGPDEIKSSCYFCPTKKAFKAVENIAGASGLGDHFSKYERSYLCTWPGCTYAVANVPDLLQHYCFAHDHSMRPLKCDECDYVAPSQETLETHKAEPHPESEEAAMSTRTRNSVGSLSLWRHAKYCGRCKKWYPPWKWTAHEAEHKRQQLRFNPTLPVQGVQLQGLRVGDNCPFHNCPYLYKDFVGWFMHCSKEHNEFIGGEGGLSATLLSEERERIPMFRCPSCLESVPVGQLPRHHVLCPASILRETLGPFMNQRAVAYNCTPGLLTLERGVRVMNERLLMGVLKEATDPRTDPKWTQSCLRAIRNDAFLRLLVERNQNAPKKCAVYTICKAHSGTVPGFGEWVKEGIFYAGSTSNIGKRTILHIKTSVPGWYCAGMRLEKDEDLYLCRMSITIDETTCAESFTRADHRRLEQVLIDSLGLGTLYNVKRALGSSTMLNDSTYRNHIAPRLNQLSLVLFESTYKRLVQTKLVPDGKTLWKLPVTWAELRNLGMGTNVDSSNGSLVQTTEPATRVDQACSPIPFPRILSPEVHDVLSRFQAERGFTDEEMDNWVLTRKARASTSSCHVEHTQTNEPPVPPAENVQSGAHDQRPDSAGDLFPDYPYNGQAEDTSPADYDPLDFADVPSTSNGSDYHALEELRASCAAATTSHRAVHQESNTSHMPAGEIVSSELPQRPSPNQSVSLLHTEVSAPKTPPVKEASDVVLPPTIGNRTVRIPRYGHLCTQYVDLDREPVSLTQDSSSEASIDDEPQQELADAPSEPSDEEPPQEFPEDSSESSLGEPSPTDSGINLHFDFEHVPGTGQNPNIEDGSDETTPKKPAKTAKAATSSVDGDHEDAADSDIYDKCACKNCRQPHYEYINWVQCDDCDEWYHSVCILGVEEAVEEDEFHCGCAENGKRKSGQVKNSKKRRVV